MTGELAAVFSALGLAPSEDQQAKLLQHLELLQRWNATYNLTAVRRREDMLRHHLADCLAVIPSLRRRIAAGRLLDVGSGGGLPGVVIATFMEELDVTCVDAVSKKAAFVRQAAGSLRLPNLHAVHARVERLQGRGYDVIVARAFASLSLLVELTRHLLPTDGAWMAMKGKVPDEEIAALPGEIDVFHVEHLTVPGLEAERCLVWMRLRQPGTR